MNICLNKYLRISCCSIVVLISAACQTPRRPQPSPTLELQVFEQDSGSVGKWRRQGDWTALETSRQKNHFEIRLVRGSTIVHVFPGRSDQFTPPWTSVDVVPGPIVLRQPAGDLEFTLADDSGRTGSYRVHPNASFKQVVEQLTGETATPNRLLWAVLKGTEMKTMQSYADTEIDLTGDELWLWIRYGIEPGDIVEFMKLLPALSASDVILLRSRGVHPEWVAQLAPQYPTFTAKDFTTLRTRGVSSSYALDVAASGKNYSADELVELHRHGIPSDWPAELAPLDKIKGAEDFILLRRYGVSLDYIKTLHDSQSVRSAEDIWELRRYGVPSEYVKTLQPLSVSASEIVQLKNRGVQADYAKQLHGDGYSIQDIIRMRQQGIPADYVAAANSNGRAPLSADSIIELRRRGVSPQTVRELRAEGVPVEN